MDGKHFLLLCAILACFYVAATQNGKRTLKVPVTSFSCAGRAAGYYADMETGCQVYHMCDGLGRKFSYSCPNTTLFQQRMLVCDHWYMVNCSKSERDYDANLLIGQRDKPFVSDDDMRFRTPRPDILSVPPNNNYYDGLKEAESKFNIHPGNSIVGIADTISDESDQDLDSAKRQFRPPTSWSSGKNSGQRTRTTPIFTKADIEPRNDKRKDNREEASRRTEPTFKPTSDDRSTKRKNKIHAPDRELKPPHPPPTTDNIDIKSHEGNEDPVFNFIKRFDPTSPDSHKTSMTKTEILNINKQLPNGQVSSEDDRSPRKHKNFGNSFNNVQSGKKKGFTDETRFNSVNLKASKPTEITPASSTSTDQIPVPDVHLLPPKTEYTQIPTTTMGPPIYYEWKWAVPALDLEPPKESNVTNTAMTPKKKIPPGKRPFSDIPRTTPKEIDLVPQNTEYNISSYFVPDYVFPLDKPHPGYDDDNAETSFHVRVSRPGRASYGENQNCPQCHPAYLVPGTCEPCIVKR